MKIRRSILFTTFFIALIFLSSRIIFFNHESDLFLGKYIFQDDMATYNAISSIYQGYNDYQSLGISPYTRVPIWPGFLASIQTIFGLTNYVAVFITLNILQFITIILLYSTSLKIYSDRTSFLICLYILALLDFTLYSFLLRPEALFTLLITVSFILIIKYYNVASNVTLATLGITLAIATLTKPIAFLSIIPVLISIAYFSNWRNFSKSILVFLISFTITLSPWLLRNYSLSHSLILQQDTGNIFFATFPGGHYGSIDTTKFIPNRSSLSEIEIDKKLTALAKKRILANPQTWIKNSIANFTYRLWSVGFIDTHLRFFEYKNNFGGYQKTPEYSAFQRLIDSINIFSADYKIPLIYHSYLIFNNILGFALIILSLLTLISFPFQNKLFRSLILFLGYFWLLTSLFSFSGSRYVIPLVPLLLFITPSTLSIFIKLLRRKHSLNTH